MYKRVCTSCGVPNMVLSQAKADKTWPCHHCEAELGPELNQQIGESPVIPSDKHYYFTFGPDERFPYQCGWVEILANSMGDAIKKFKMRFGEASERHPGVLNCADMYSADIWNKTSMTETGNLGAYCHEVIE